MTRRTRPVRPCELCEARSRPVHPRKATIGLRCPSEPALWAGSAFVILSAVLLVAVVAAQVFLAVTR